MFSCPETLPETGFRMDISRYEKSQRINPLAFLLEKVFLLWGVAKTI